MSPNDLYLTYPDFDENSYRNRVMQDLRFRIVEDNSLLLKPGTDWIKIETGGFTIIKPGYAVNEDSRFTVQFY